MNWFPSTYLNPPDVEIADQVPGRLSVGIHPLETVPRRIVDGIS